jgi:4-hydroxyacetophenone monooxygenase
MAWGVPQVSSWYKSASGRVSQNWPFALVDYWEATRAPDPADFAFWSEGARAAAE